MGSSPIVVTYILSGSFCNSPIPNSTAFVCHTLKWSSEIVTDTLDKTVEKFCGIGKIGIEENQCFYKYFCEKISFNENENRYKVKLLFKEFHDIVPDNFENCKRGFNSLKKKFLNNEYLLSQYNQIIKDQLQADVIEKFEQNTTEHEVGQVHYLPHLPVIRNDKQTTKVRIVYDASSKIGNSPSLNDCLLPGPSLTQSLFGVLIRFRFYNMRFLQILKRHFCKSCWVSHIVILSDFYISRI